LSITKDRRRLSGQLLEGITDHRADCRNALATGSTWRECSIDASQFGQANFANAFFDRCTFRRCSFDQAVLIARFQDCTFTECSFDQASFAAAEIRNTTFDGGSADYSTWERATVLDSKLGLSLHGARLDFAEGRGVDWSGANLWNALIPLGCAFFAGSRVDAREEEMFLALLMETKGELDRSALEQMVSPDNRSRRVVMRLLRGGGS
jgi:uncharacterized protein YjbI with pentapeptide repeats